MEFSKPFKLAAWSYVNQAMSMGLLLVQVKVLTFFLPVSDFGAWSQVNAAKVLVSIMLCLNIGHGFIRFASAYSVREKERCFHSVLFFQTVLFLLAALFVLPFYAPVTNFLSGASSLRLYWVLVGVSFFAMLTDNVQRYLLVTGRELQMVRQNLMRLVFSVGFIVGGVWLGHDLMGALCGYMLSEASCWILFSWINRIDYCRFSYSHDIVKKLLAFSAPLMTMSVAYWVIDSSNRYLVNYFMGLEAVGRFSVANRLPMMLVIIFTLLSTIFLSNVARLFDAKNFGRVSYWFSLIIKLFLYLGVAGGGALIAGNRALTLILSNKSYLFDGLPTVYLFVVIGSLAFGVFQIVSRLYELETQVYRSSLNWIAAMGLNVGLNVWLIPQLGLIGGAIATGISFLVAFLIGWFFRPRRIVLHVSSLRLLVYAFAALSTAWLYAVYCDGQMVSGVWTALFVSAGFGGLTLLFGLLLRVVTWQELMALVNRS